MDPAVFCLQYHIETVVLLLVFVVVPLFYHYYCVAKGVRRTFAVGRLDPQRKYEIKNK